MLSIPPGWMNWTLSTIIFLGSIISLLVTLTVWDVNDPGWARKGLLPIETTRGDRVFMGLLLTGCLFCFWLYFFTQTAVWGVLVLGALVMVGTVRFF